MIRQERAMDDPIAFFLTWPTYGTWLPGDSRGWVDYQHGWQLPDPSKVREAKAQMTEDACILTFSERQIVEAQVAETCEHRNWRLYGANCRSNHIHVVVGAAKLAPKPIRSALKAWCTRRLRERSDPDRKNWWASRGSGRYVFDEDRLEVVLQYVLEAQDRMHLERP
jgi:REP element-mobilizing transposase RayT